MKHVATGVGLAFAAWLICASLARLGAYWPPLAFAPHITLLVCLPVLYMSMRKAHPRTAQAFLIANLVPITGLIALGATLAIYSHRLN